MIASIIKILLFSIQLFPLYLRILFFNDKNFFSVEYKISSCEQSIISV